MIRGIFYFLFLVICGASSFAQQITFNRAYDVDSGYDAGAAVIQTLDKGFLVGGETDAFGFDDLYFVKTDSAGNTIWSKVFDVGFGGDHVTGLIELKDSSIIACGITVVDSPLNYDVFLMKISKDGDSIWFRTYGDTADNYGDDVKQTADGGLIILANTKDYFTDTLLDFNAWLIKTDSNGNIEWDSVYGGTGSDITEKLIIANDGGFVFAGEKGSDGWLAKTDSNGNLLWERIFDNAEYLDFEGGIIQTLDGGFLLTGAHNISTMTYAYVLKTDEFGNKQWDSTYGNANSFFWAAAVQLQDSSYVVAGSDFVTPDNLEGWLLKIAPDGTELWSRYYTKYGYYAPASKYNQEYIFDLKITNDRGFVFCGWVTNYGFFTYQDMWLVKVDSNGCLVPGCNVGIEEMEHEEVSVKVYPNPFSHSATLQIANWYEFANEKVELRIYDVLGREVRNMKLKSENTKLERGDLPEGVYFYQITNDKKTIANGKFVISN